MRPYRYLLSILLLGLVACLSKGMAQTIPNAGFEDWPGGVLSGWTTSNSPPTYVNVTQSADKHSGSWAVMGTVADVGYNIGYPPSMVTDPGFPMNSRPAALHGWYKLSLGAGDMFSLVVAFKTGGTGVGGGSLPLNTSTSIYKEFVLNVGYASSAIPDSGYITMNIFGSLGYATVGSFFLVDDLSWGTATAVNEPVAGTPARFALEQNYPNPFNPTTTIGYGVSGEKNGSGVSGQGSSLVRLSVFDLLGREVAVLVNENQQPGQYRVQFNAQNLSTGIYFYRLQSGSSIATKTLTVLK